MATKYTISTENFKSGIDLASLVAKRAESLLLGNGYEVKKLEGATDRDHELIEELYINQNLIGVLSDVERDLSKYGEKGVIVDYDGNGDIRFSLCEQQSRFYATTSGKLVGARTFRRIAWGATTYAIQETWALNKPIKRTITNQKGIVIPIADFNINVTPELQLQEQWDYAKLGRIPIILFQNLNSVGNKSEPDGKYVKIIQDQLDHALLTLYKETEMTRTRIGVDEGNEKLVRDIKQGGLGAILNDSIMITDSGYGEDGYHSPIEVISNEFKSMEYQEIIKFYQDLYFDGAGYSTLSDASGEMTVIGTMYTHRKDMETTRKKLKIREQQLEGFQELVKDMLGITSDFALKLKTNILYDEQSKMDYLRSGEELGIISKYDKVAIFFGLSDEEEIQAKLDLLDKEDEEQMKKMMELEGDQPNGDEENPNNFNQPNNNKDEEEVE